VGGVYLLWLAWQMVRGKSSVRLGAAPGTSMDAPSNLFLRGFITDLANPQTVLFFASIFAVTLTASTPVWARILSWFGIVAASAVWRVLLSFAFSRERVRSTYSRWQHAIERVVGAAFAAFGARLIAEGISRR
jgi:amino acid exporter